MFPLNAKSPFTSYSCLAKLLFGSLLAWFCLCPLLLKAGEPPPQLVYTWDAASWLKNYNRIEFSASPITNPDGTTGAEIAVTPRDAGNPYNAIIVSSASLQGGNEYTALITFSVVTPTVYPNSFYMFARNSVGNQYDIWQTWVGVPGPTRTIALPLNLKEIPGGTWKLYAGISKSGALRINKMAVYLGNTSDGTSTYSTVPPVVGGTPTAVIPDGVTKATGYQPFTVTPPSSKGPTITLTAPTYNFIADQPGAPSTIADDNAKALQKAVDDCKAQGAAKLVIPTGSYRLANTDNIRLDSLSDLIVDGQGARLIFEKLTKSGNAILVSNCNRVAIKNLNIDWDWSTIPIASLGVVSNLSADKLQCDFTFPDLDAAQTKITQTTHWRGIFGMNSENLVTEGQLHFAVPKETVISPGSKGNVLHAVFPKPVPFVANASYCIRHLYYEMAGFKIADSTDLTLDTVNIYSIPGMGFFFNGAMDRFQLVNCHIMRQPGSRTPLTTAADGFHVDQSVGNLIIDKCSITGTGDDAMNIHSETYEGTIVRDPTDPTKVTLLNCPPYQLKIKVGDSVEFFNADFSNLDQGETPVSRIVSQVSSITHGAPKTIVQFTLPVPDGCTPQSIIRNSRLTTRNVLISDCDIEHSSGRGILLSAQDATIQNCHTKDLFGIPIDLESDIVQGLWTEGRGASNVLIKDNVFENSNKQGRYGGASIYTNTRMPWGPTTATLYKQITIEDNQFVNSPGPIVSLTNASNVIVTANEIHSQKAIPDATRYAGSIYISKSSHLFLGGDKWINDAPASYAYGIVYDPTSTTDILPGVNSVTNSH